MSTNTVTKAFFSRMCGVSKPAIAKAVDTNRIKLINKRVNLDHRLTCEYFYSKTGKRLKALDHIKAKPEPPPKKVKKAVTPKPAAAPVKKKKPIKPKPKPVKEKAPAAQIEPPPPPVEPITAPYEEVHDDGYSLPQGVKTMDDLTPDVLNLMPHDFIKKMKDTEAMLSTKTKREELLGTLIRRSTVRTVFAKLHTIDTNQWKTLEDRLAPGVSGIFGFEEGCKEEVEVRRIINEEVAKTLRHSKRLLDDFLVKNKEAVL